MANELTPKPSDSMSERARELYDKLMHAQFSATGHQELYEQIIIDALTAERTDAFNLGAGGAYADAAQVAKAFSPSMPESEWNWNAIFGLRIGEAIERRTPPDASVAIERRVSEARLYGAELMRQAFRRSLNVCFTPEVRDQWIAQADAYNLSELEEDQILVERANQRIAQLQAEAAGKEGK